MAKPVSRGFKGGLFVLLLGTALMLIGVASHGPDRNLVFVREAGSASTPETLGRAIANLSEWPKWNTMSQSAVAVDFRSVPYSAKDQALQAGERIRLVIVPEGKAWRRFELVLEITRYQKDRFVAIRLISDSSGKITRLFDRLEWKIELLPSARPGEKSLIRGTLVGHTANWRSRLFGTLTPRLLMSQVFYPNLQALSEIGNAVPVNPYAQFER